VLVLAQRTAKEGDARELAIVGVDAWTFAERALDALVGRFAAAARAIAVEAAASRRKRTVPSESNPRRWS